MTEKPRLVVTNWVHPEVLELLGTGCEVIANQRTDPLTPAELAEQAAEADGLIAFMPDRVDAALLARCPRLKIVAGALKGYDNFDVVACSRRGIRFSIVPDLLTEPTAELTVGLMIALGRNLLAGDRHVRSGDFDGWRPRFYGVGLTGARVGLLGMGRIGRAVTQRLTAMQARVRWWDPRPPAEAEIADLDMERTDLDTVLGDSDFVVVALSLAPETLHLVDAAALARMRPETLLVNPARGSVVDESAVADALEAGRLAGYAADVFEMEDWARPDRPRQVEPRLRALADRTVLTPHLGSAVGHVRREIALRAADNVLDLLLRGAEPRDAINLADLAADAC